jgi:hypothetical protein
MIIGIQGRLDTISSTVFEIYPGEDEALGMF